MLYAKGFPPTETGGPVEVAYRLAREFVRSDSLELTLVVQTDSEERDVRRMLGDPSGLGVIRLGYFPSPSDLRSVRRVFRAFRTSDLLHFNEFPLRHLGYVLLAKVTGIRTVFSLHGLLSEEAGTFLGPDYPLRIQSGGREVTVRAPSSLVSLVVRLYRWMAPHWSAVVANSEAHATRAVDLENFDPGRIHLIPNGVDVPPQPTPPAVDRGGPVRLLFVGKLERVKGPDLLLSALERLGRQGVSVDLSLAGGGSLEAELREQAGRLPGQRVTFHGSIPHDAVLPLYEWADIVVVPSRYESFGLVVLEAMAAGKPLVATSVGGIPSVVSAGRNAVLVPPEAGAIADGILELIRAPGLRAEMAKANAIDVAAYSWTEIAPRYVALYRGLARRSGEN